MAVKQSDFTLNSDFLSIAQVDSKTYTVNVGGGTLTPGGYTEQNFDFTTIAQTGALDRIIIKKDGNSYVVGSYMTLVPVASSDFTRLISGFLSVYRTSKTNLRAQLVLENLGTSNDSYPSMTFTIKVSSFKPPNVF